ncbi:MAG: ASPIC/UnbV domain-containing protein [Planctomycetota bacterium]
MDRDESIHGSRTGGAAAFGTMFTGINKGASWSGHERNHFWRNLGGKDFLEMSGISAVDMPWDSRTFSLFDYDQDGFQDFVLVNANRPMVQVFRNRFGDLLPEGKRGGVIRVRLEGGNFGNQSDPEWSNRDGIGARLLVDLGDRTVLREYRCGEGLGTQNSSTIVIGIGTQEHVAGIKVLWPSGRTSEVGQVPAGALITVQERASVEASGGAVQVTEMPPLQIRADGNGASGPASAPSLGHSPELTALLDGKTEAPYRLVMSWFTACAACKRAEPTLQALREVFPEQELAIFGFNNDSGDSRKEMEQYRDKFRPSYVMLLDRSKADIKAFKSLQDRILDPYRGDEPSVLTPGCLLLDAEGQVVKAWIGVPSVSEMKQFLTEGR